MNVSKSLSPAPFRNPNQPLQDRVDDLISRLTLEEKVSLLHQYQPAILRLGMQAFKTGTEALHGVAWLGIATVFPQAIGLASTSICCGIPAQGETRRVIRKIRS